MPPETASRRCSAPAAMVPSGAAAGLTLGTAAVLTGEDPDRIRRIPNLTGMKSETWFKSPIASRTTTWSGIAECG
jgi:hypothetical protein